MAFHRPKHSASSIWTGRAAAQVNFGFYDHGLRVALDHVATARCFLPATPCAEAQADGHSGDLFLQGEAVPADELEGLVSKSGPRGAHRTAHDWLQRQGIVEPLPCCTFQDLEFTRRTNRTSMSRAPELRFWLDLRQQKTDTQQKKYRCSRGCI